jgi:hypothetical protein
MLSHAAWSWVVPQNSKTYFMSAPPTLYDERDSGEIDTSNDFSEKGSTHDPFALPRPAALTRQDQIGGCGR